MLIIVRGRTESPKAHRFEPERFYN